MSKRRFLPPLARSPGPKAESLSKPVPFAKRRLNRAALLVAFLLFLLVLTAAVTLPGMWRETQRREAYLPALESEAAHASEDGPLLALVGAGRMAAGENSEAADALRQAIAAGESNEETWKALAASTAASGDRTRALADLRLGIQMLPHSIVLHGALAEALITDPSSPPPILAAVIDPQGPALLLGRYGAGSRLNGLEEWWGRHHPAESGFATRHDWAEERPGDAQAQRLWGEALLRNRRVPEAGAALTLALSLAPQSPDTNLAIADYFDQSGFPTKAALQYITCLKLRPDWFPALMGLGHTTAKISLPTYAGPAFERTTWLNPRSTDAWIGLGRAYMDIGSSDKGQSLAAFTTAAHLEPNRIDFLPDYANALRLNDRWDDAEAVLRRRLAAVPNDGFCHFLLGLTLIDNNPTPAREAEAEAETREAIRLTPQAAKPKVQLADMLLRRNQLKNAIALLTDALKIEPYNERTMKLLARAYQQDGQILHAQQIGNQAEALTQDRQQVLVLEAKAGADPLNIIPLQQLAALYRRVGASDKALHEQAMIDLIRTDPKKAAQELHSLDTLIQSVLPKTPEPTPK